LKTINGGDTWIRLPSGTSNDLYSIFFTDEKTGYAVGAGGAIIKTLTGGIQFLEEKISKPSNFIIYPNPSSSNITIKSYKKFSGGVLVSIFSIRGENVFIKTFQTQNQPEIDISNFAKGIYLVKIQSKTGIEYKKLVVD